MRCTEVWIPDVFGYPAGLPQLFVGRRDAPLRHPEAVVEPHQPLPPPHVLVGGHRRLPGAHPLPARRHVQRRDHAGRAGPRVGELRRARVERLVAAAVRLRRRWRRSDEGDARPGAADRRPRRACRGSSWARPPGSSPRSRPRPPAGAPVPVVAGRAVLRDPPRHAHQPAAHQARQPALRAAAPRGSSCGRRRRDAAIPARARRAVAGGAHPAVPRHPARARRSPGSTPTPRPRTPASATSSSRASSPASATRAGRAGAGQRRRPTSATRSSSPTSSGRRRSDAAAARRAHARSAPACPASGSRPPRRSPATSGSSSPTARWPTADSPWAGTSTATCARSSTSPTPASCCPPGGSARCSSSPRPPGPLRRVGPRVVGPRTRRSS